MNLIYADRAGDIGLLSTGFMPKRRENGLVPRRLPGKAQWDGVFPIAEMTKVVNPVSGYVHTANEYNLPEALAREHLIGFEWTESSRSRRIKACLDKGDTVALADALALQLDKKSLIAERVLAFAARVTVAHEAVQDVVKRLVAWDCVLDPESREAALFEIWHARHLKPALVALAAGKAFPMERISNEAACDFLESLDAGSDQVKALIEKTLEAAFEDLASTTSGWARRWSGAICIMPCLPCPVGSGNQFPIVGPFRQGGSESTVFHSGFDAANFVKLTGSTFRVVIDLADLDKSLCINAPGQSGDSASPFYDAMAPLWAEGRVVPLLCSAPVVRANARLEIEVVSASPA